MPDSSMEERQRRRDEARYKAANLGISLSLEQVDEIVDGVKPLVDYAKPGRGRNPRFVGIDKIKPDYREEPEWQETLPVPKCKTCRDGGRVRRAVPVGHPDFGRAILCPDCDGGERYTKAPEDQDAEFLRRSRIPLRFHGCRIDTWEPWNGPERQEVEKWGRQWPPEKPFLLLAGNIGCIAGETLIQGPHGSATIESLWQSARRFEVWALVDGAVVGATAEPPFVKGVADLYRVTLSDGRQIVTTREHRFLTPNGWLPLGQLAVGDSLAVGLVLAPSSSALVHAGSLPSGRGWRGTLVGSSGRCFGGSRRYGQPLPSGEGSGPVLVPSRADALARNRAGFYWDDRATSPANSRPCPECDRQSRSGSAPWGARPLGAWTRPCGPVHCESLSLSSRTPQLALQGWPRSRSERADPGEAVSRGMAGSSWAYRTISDVAFERTDRFFDLHVPGPENYLANGIWNHNTGKTHLACGTLWRIWHQWHRRGIFWNVADLIERYKASYDEERRHEVPEAIDDELDRWPVLVLDDFGVEQATPNAARLIYGIVNRRYNAKLPLIITTNVALPADRVTSRLGDIESTLAVHFGGPDHRSRKQP